MAYEKLAIGRVLVTCDEDNVGSIRTIEENDGVLENVVSGPDLDKPKRRYGSTLRLANIRMVPCFARVTLRMSPRSAAFSRRGRAERRRDESMPRA